MILDALRPNRGKSPVSKQLTMPFPVGGWDASSPLAAMKPDRAVQLKNWFPQPGWGEIRRGFSRHASNVVSSSTPVQTLMAWRGAASSKMFAAGSTAIYDVTANASATSSLTGLTNARWQHVNMTTAAGHYLFIVNGADSPRHYNGSAWETPSITGFTASEAIHVNTHKKRLWLIPANSTTAYYLATDAIAGAATSFALGSLFTRGGYLMAMSTWTRDGGAGSDDYAVFISSEGQVAIYQGTDPASSTTWSLVGVFDTPPPIGRRCFFRWGADLGLITLQGVYPLSQLLAVDQSQANRVSLTENIARAFSDAHRLYGANWGWEGCVYPKGTRLIVNIPTNENATAVQYVMNTLTGAWCEYDAHHANCWIVYNEAVYFGGMDGAVYKADSGALDYDRPIVAVGQAAYSALGTPKLKAWKMIRPLITASGAFRPGIGVSTDFTETDTLSDSDVSISGSISVFGTAVFDTATFATDINNVSDWVDVGAIGSFGSIKFTGLIGVDSAASRGLWGVSAWGNGLWGVEGGPDEVMRINGFLVLAEVGGSI
ncbi:hypothetical protein UFOVP1157_5 [uncultured Caudovirales phage]|uniref:Uncharacterized protein n=1 Tax=uncultured Caudovirales phage TaxID=2100421 RepID=A0A6J5STX6_9CAUD|nr:hypothetical protein UFOVP497_30 [uncultured Caudovirales phage]CAB4164218.1 hypothetical protein UFOVP834_6 [uncultured Caudovirales phage]CAB4172348.1 hypothetical protein UFOVP922_5 [uncultured Caudovirales phage]CAB4177805.1 hypothetical protein UFOVP1006_58 [uncultured Caudovirales phage]CAB4183880.1 hypothetical protein UFOVP1096_22 [uncultured Caudovirales phage]